MKDHKNRDQKDIETLIMIIALAAMGFFIWMSIMFATTSCGPSIVIPPDGPTEPADAGTEDDCPMACANLAFLQCPGWRGSPGPDEVWNTADDISCEKACVSIMRASSTATLYQKCTARATSCEAVEWCFDPSLKKE